MSTQRSFQENVAPGVHVTFEAERLLYQVKSAAHEKLVIENAQFGRMMMIDGTVHLSSADAFIYHEMMCHVPLLAHGQVERVLIVGGGSGGLAAEVLKHRGIRRLVQVESDPQLVRLAGAYFGGMNAAVFGDTRFRLHNDDGAGFVATTDERFDLILVDSADSGGVSPPLLTEAFYRNARGCLKPGGLLVARLGAPFLQALAFPIAMKRLATVFPKVSCYLVPVPSFFGGPLALGWASNVLSSESPEFDVLTERYMAARIDTRYYTPEVHRAAFALPRYLKNAVVAATRPHEEGPRAVSRSTHRRKSTTSLEVPEQLTSRSAHGAGGGHVAKSANG
jgi:spermidine synthase